VLNAASLAICGFISSLSGGLISDYFEKKNKRAKSIVCMVSSFMAFPLTAACCLNQGSFWFSIIAITLKTLLSGGFSSPAITMMQNTTSSKDQGNIISSHMFYTTIVATFTPILFGLVSNIFGAASDPRIYGYVLTLFAGLGYWGSIPFWFLAGKSYEEYMVEQEKDN
jgi:MFS family permease